MLKIRMLLAIAAAGFAWPGAALATHTPVPVPTSFFGAVNLADTTPRQVWWQTEGTPCEGNDGGTPTMFILDPGCAVQANQGSALFLADTALAAEIQSKTYGAGFQASWVANGLLANFTSNGVTATVTIPSAIWGPLLKHNVDQPGLVTIDVNMAGLPIVSDYVFTIDVATGNVTSFSWTANATTALGPAVLNVALLPGTTANFYTAEAIAGLNADGATVWACGTGGVIAQPANNPGADPGSLGTCPPDSTNLSPTTTNTAYNAATGTLFANASSFVLSLTPRAWAPLDGRLSNLTPEPGTLLMLGAGLVGLAFVGRRQRL